MSKKGKEIKELRYTSEQMQSMTECIFHAIAYNTNQTIEHLADQAELVLDVMIYTYDVLRNNPEEMLKDGMYYTHAAMRTYIDHLEEKHPGWREQIIAARPDELIESEKRDAALRAGMN